VSNKQVENKQNSSNNTNDIAHPHPPLPPQPSSNGLKSNDKSSSRSFSHSISLENDNNGKQRHSNTIKTIDANVNAKKNFNLDQSSMLVLNKLFGSGDYERNFDDDEKKTKPPPPPHSSSSASSSASSSNYTRKISLDETQLSSRAQTYNGFNSKLEEFKRVVENSYNQHVLHKVHSTPFSLNSSGNNNNSKQQQLSRQSSTNSDDTKQNTNSASSASFSYKNIFNSNNNDVTSSSLMSLTNEQKPQLVEAQPQANSGNF